jgi:RHS repeat-associated protein
MEGTKDHWYDYGARMYDPALGRWFVIDIMNEKHTDYSPYAYVYNNPVLYTDQFGLDTFIIDTRGRFADNSLPSEENDVIIKVSNEERRNNRINYKRDGSLRNSHKTSNGFEQGSISVRPRTRTNSSGKTTFIETGIRTRNNFQAEDVFNFLADNTSVEYSKIEFSNITSIQNLITTSHQPGLEPYGSRFTYQLSESNNSFTLISHTHNHPSSGQGDQSRPSSNNEDGSGDIQAYEQWVQRQGNNFRVFIRYNGVTREFTTTGNQINR